MSLPEDYTSYPNRKYGSDNGRYDWRLSIDRPKIAWPNGAAVACAVICPLEFHMLNPGGKPFKHPGAMVTPYPDLRHFTTRDYGNRVGAFRLLTELKAAGVKATFPVNAVLLKSARPLIDAIVEDGHEIAAYGLDTDHIHWSGLDRATERDWVQQTRAAFDAAGLTPRAWMSPARQQSFVTLDLIAEAGFDICLDWETDTTPLPMRTEAGLVLALPISTELDDRVLIVDKRQTEDDWAAQILEAADYMKSEAPRFGGQVLGFTVTAYLMGQPFRIASFRKLLAGLAQDAAIWTSTVSEIAQASPAA